MTDRDEPFSTIESVQEFLALLGAAIESALDEVRAELATCAAGNGTRRLEAWQLVLYTTTKLASHVAASRRLLNDLRTLRNLLDRTGAMRASETAPTAVGVTSLDSGVPVAQGKA